MLANLTIVLLVQTLGLPVPKPLKQRATLTIEVVNVEKNRGKVVVEIYNEKSGWLKSPFRRAALATGANAATASFDVPPGKYAVSVYQDLNENNRLDQNFLGIPKEPIGFGNNYKPFGKPSFEPALIDHKPAGKSQAIKLFSVL